MTESPPTVTEALADLLATVDTRAHMYPAQQQVLARARAALVESRKQAEATFDTAPVFAVGTGTIRVCCTTCGRSLAADPAP